MAPRKQKYSVGDIIALKSFFIYEKNKTPEYLLITGVHNSRYYYYSLSYGSESNDMIWVLENDLSTYKVA